MAQLNHDPCDVTPWPAAGADDPTLDTGPVPQDPGPEVFSIRDVARIFGRTERTIRNWVRAGHLQRGGFGRAVFFTRAAIDALLASAPGS
jgi:hypothetical protein